MIRRSLRALAAASSLAASMAWGDLPVVPGEPAVPPATIPARLHLPAPKARSSLELPPVAEDEMAKVRNANPRMREKRAQRVVIGVVRTAADAASLADARQMPWSPV